jgi:hypothetical protein
MPTQDGTPADSPHGSIALALLLAVVGVGAAATGGVGPLLSTLAGGAAGNEFHKTIGVTRDWYSRWQAGAEATARNYDITALAARAVVGIVQGAEEAFQGHPHGRAVVQSLAGLRDAHWAQALRDPRFAELNDEQLVDLARAPHGGLGTRTGDIDLWREIIACAYGQANALADVHTLTDAQQMGLIFVAARLRERFAAQFNGLLREGRGGAGGAGGGGGGASAAGRALVAVQMHLANQQLVAIDALDQRLRTGEKRLTDAIDESAELCFLHFQELYRLIGKPTNRQDTLFKIAERIEDKIGKQPPPTSPPPRDNLTAANVPNNRATFKGRVDDLRELHRRVQSDPDGLPIPVIAAPGLGKSALVTRYVYLHQGEFDHVWWVRASNPGGRTQGSAEERSLAALLDLWGIESKAIQGDDRTPRIDALAAAVRTWLARPSPSGANSGAPVRHLLVLDNVDDYATIARLRIGAPSRVVFTARASALLRSGARAMNLRHLSPDDGLQVLRAKTTRWDAPEHTPALTTMGEQVGWNALALVYLAAVLARPSTVNPAVVRDALIAALRAGSHGPMSAPRPEERPDDHDAKVEEAFALFIAPYAGKPEMAVLEAAALCAPDGLAQDLLGDASGLTADAFGAALDELVSAGVLTIENNAVSIHRLTQVSVRGHMAARGPVGVADALRRALRACIKLFADTTWSDAHAPRRTAALAHVEALVTSAALWDCASAQQAEQALDVHARAARLRADVAVHLWLIGQLPDAQRHIDAAIDWGEQQTPRDERSLAIWYATRARIRQDRGDLAAAEADIQRSIDWGEKQTPRDERSLAIRFASRARIRQDRGDLVGAEADLQRSIDWSEKQTPRDERSLAIRYASRAGIRQARGDLTGAESDIQRSIDWSEKQTQRDERSLAMDYATRARVRRARGDLPKAEADIQRSIDWGERQSPRNDRDLSLFYALRASIRRDRAKLAEAEADIQRSIDWFEMQNPRNERELSIHYASRACIRRDRGDITGAAGDIQRSIDWFEKQNPRNEHELSIHYALRASIRSHGRDLVGAQADLQQSIDWLESQSSRNERGLAIVYDTQALILAKADRFEQAKVAIDKTVRFYTAVFGPDHEWTRRAIRRQQAIHAGRVPD